MSCEVHVRFCEGLGLQCPGLLTLTSPRAKALYLACVMDLASRRIVGWSMGDRITAELVCQALKSAYWQRKPAAGLIMHSDRGCQYASDAHRKLIKDYRMIQSMSRTANCWDNAAMESFFKTLKGRAHPSASL